MTSLLEQMQQQYSSRRALLFHLLFLLLRPTSPLPDGETPPHVRSNPPPAQLSNQFCSSNGIYFRQLLAGVDVAKPSKARTVFETQSFKFAKQMQNYIYLIGDRETGDTVVVDGCWDPKGINKLAKRDGMKIVGFVATHYHWDHVGGQVDYEPFKSMNVDLPGLKDFVLGSSKRKRELNNNEIKRKAWISSIELEKTATRTGVPREALTGLEDGSVVDIGARLRLTFRHTPGHSPGSMVVLVSERSPNESSGGGDGGGGGDKPLFMVSGDTLFPGSCGRVDLPESDPVQMWDSLQIVKGYSDDLVVFPGHAYSGSNTTIGKESRNGLLGMTKKEWMRGR